MDYQWNMKQSWIYSKHFFAYWGWNRQSSYPELYHKPKGKSNSQLFSLHRTKFCVHCDACEEENCCTGNVSWTVSVWILHFTNEDGSFIQTHIYIYTHTLNMPPPSWFLSPPKNASTWQCLSGSTQQQLYEWLPSRNLGFPYNNMSENRKNIRSWDFPPFRETWNRECLIINHVGFQIETNLRYSSLAQ